MINMMYNGSVFIEDVISMKELVRSALISALIMAIVLTSVILSTVLGFSVTTPVPSKVLMVYMMLFTATHMVRVIR